MPDIQIKRGTRSAFTSLKSGSGLIVGQPYYITDENVLAIADTTSTASEYGVSDNFPISKLNIDGGTDIGAALVDTDLMIVDDGANGTNRKSAMSRLWTYISGKMTGAISSLLTSNLTASRALVSDGSGKIVVASGGTTATEIGYLNGVTSAIQGQLNGKQASLVSGTNIKTVNSSSLLGSGDLGVQATLVSGTNIKTINSNSILGSGNLAVGLTNWSESTNTYSSKVGVQYLANNAGSNVDAVISPKGTGAFYLGPYADGTATGGNNRGDYAVDLQIIRGSASAIASGAYAVVAGVSNTASGATSIAIGSGNYSTGVYSIAMGYSSSSVGSNAISMGYSNSAIGDYSVSLGSDNDSLSLSSLTLGTSNIASGSYSTAIGYLCEASEYYSIALGVFAKASKIGQLAHSAGGFNGLGLAQSSEYLMGIQTTNATPTELLLNFSNAGRLTLDIGSIYACEIMIVGKTSGAVTGYKYERRCVIAMGSTASTTTLLGSTDVIGTDYEANGSANIAILADTINGALKIEVTGISSTTINWIAKIKTTELILS